MNLSTTTWRLDHDGLIHNACSCTTVGQHFTQFCERLISFEAMSLKPMLSVLSFSLWNEIGFSIHNDVFTLKAKTIVDENFSFTVEGERNYLPNGLNRSLIRFSDMHTMHFRITRIRTAYFFAVLYLKSVQPIFRLSYIQRKSFLNHFRYIKVCRVSPPTNIFNPT